MTSYHLYKAVLADMEGERTTFYLYSEFADLNLFEGLSILQKSPDLWEERELIELSKVGEYNMPFPLNDISGECPCFNLDQGP